MWYFLVSVFGLSAASVVLFIFWLIPAKTKDRNIFLVILLLSLIVQFIAEILFHIGFISIEIFSILATSMVVNLGPSLYFYDRKFYHLPSKNYFWHILLAQTGLATIWFFNFFLTAGIPQWLLSAYYSMVLIGYLAATVILMSRSPVQKNSSWLNTIGRGFGVLVFLHIVEVLWINFDLESAVTTAIFNTFIQNIFSTFFLLLVIKQIIQNPQTFSEINIRIPYKYGVADFKKSELDLIVSYIEGEKAYKNSELKSSTVSEVTGLRTNKISEIINHSYKKNFNDWLNDYRIDDAKKYLSDSSLTIQEIYYEVGFNSKSAFNAAFKREKKLHLQILG